MQLDPRTWGRTAQAALGLLILIRLPTLATMETAAGVLGAVFGIGVTAIVVVGLVRHLVVSVRGRGDGDESATAA